MSNALVNTMAVWGIGSESTAGTSVASTVGFPNLQRASIRAGATWSEPDRATGKTVELDVELKPDVHTPTWSPQTTMFHPWMGFLMQLLCQNVSQAGAGPFTQTIQPDMANGKKVTVGDSSGPSARTCTAWEKLGQTTSRDARGVGGIVVRIEVRSGSSGLIEVSPTFNFLKYDKAVDGSAGTYTPPGSAVEKATTDFVCKIGAGTPAALYSEEWNFTIAAEFGVHRYGGQNTRYPFALVLKKWTLEGSFMKPVLAGSDKLAKDYVVDGDELVPVFPVYIYSRTLADYNTALSQDGQMRFTLNVRLDEPELDLGSDETVERASFRGKADGTFNIFKMEQCTTASQGWAV